MTSHFLSSGHGLVTAKEEGNHCYIVLNDQMLKSNYEMLKSSYEIYARNRRDNIEKAKTSNHKKRLHRNEIKLF